jgi:hypothetical protein
VPVVEANECYPCPYLECSLIEATMLTNAAISVSAQGAYNAAFSQLPPLDPTPACSCPDASDWAAQNPVCCIAGQCQLGGACIHD